MNRFIPRRVQDKVESTLEKRGCVLLLGPRQVGKTELARKLVDNLAPDSVYLDLEQDDNYHDPLKFKEYVQDHACQLMVLDEAQCAPDIFPILRHFLDRREEALGVDVKWLLLGSATTELQALANQHLTGRFAFVDLTPFLWQEIGVDQSVASSATPTASFAMESEQSVRDFGSQHELMESLWLKGGFPKSYLEGDAPTSIEWRKDYLRSVLGCQGISSNSLPRHDLLLSVWQQLSINQGECCDVDQLPGRLSCKKDDLQRALNFLEQAQLIRQLRPWFQNEGKRLQQRPRVYIRDSGLLHERWGFKTIDELRAHKIIGKSWEGFVLESLVNAAPSNVMPYFYRNDRKEEVDIVMEFSPTTRWAIEVKLSDSAGAERGFHAAADELKAVERFIVHGGSESIRPMSAAGLDRLCLSDAIIRISTQ